MENVTVRRDQVLRKLKQNLDNHRAIFNDAVEGYREKAVSILEEHIEDIRNGKMAEVRVSLPPPVDHTKDYERAIAMVEMSVHDDIELSEVDFQQYVMDDWRWKREFIANSAMYTDIE